MQHNDSRSPLPAEQPHDEDVMAESAGHVTGSGAGSPLPSDQPEPEDVLRPGGGPAAVESEDAKPREQPGSDDAG